PPRRRTPSCSTQKIPSFSQGAPVTKPVPPALQPFRGLAGPLRLRVTTDAEGFPMFPGRYGRVEWFDGQDLAVYCDRRRLFAKLWAIPGVHRHQTGDDEMRAVFPPEALKRVAAVIQAKRWGGSGRGRVQNLVADAGQMGPSAA